MRLSGTITKFFFENKEFRFFVENTDDAIQRHHYNGNFYEISDLELIRQHVKPGSICVDIGANVGNHAIFLSEVIGAKRVYIFEPNKKARDILEVNILLNMVTNIDARFATFGLSDKSASGVIETRHQNNLGLSKFKQEAGGDIQVIRGDELLKEVDFLKIDVEGHEISVLEGLQETIRTCRPLIYIEVSNKNRTQFMEWIAQYNYAIKGRIKQYELNENFLLIPE